jgi:GH25 family lysozyme M1 (1,4-beta-N-acetylmuramidase)
MSFRRRAAVVIALSLALLAVAISRSPGQNPNNPKGIDVSYWQGGINWTSVKNSGITFAIIRAGHGDSAVDSSVNATGTDKNFTTNWPAAKGAGLVRGAYWYIMPSASPSVTENATALAAKFVNTVQPKEGDLQLTIDFENNANSLTTAQMQTWMQTCVNQIKATTHRPPMIYCSQSFWNTNMPAGAGNMGCPLWVANWGVTSPKLPNAWTTYAFWQYTSSGTTPGISGNVDQDTVNGDSSFMMQYAYPRDPINRR